MSKDTADAKAARPRFPKRDDEGRIELLTEYLAFVLASLFIGMVMLVAIDGVLALIHVNAFGSSSGWIGAVLAVFVFIDDFRAWKPGWTRWAVAGVAAVVSLAFGFVITSLMPPEWYQLFTGALGATIGCLLYTVLWFYGVRLLKAGRS
ncbi:MAG TPA: hypothetical protein VE172_17955 [Stackebrandtia sp.]|jgi:hypothetical protein|uniref:hypothetical protein n=1 Tax=Stackebrandtia sp. TaxID=2023065 RepID=UPI002D228DC8|nr:hypothetical protein [Stackebrandtia sp.]HZE40690.1 hypothetical protein [Stackebrandtia sp.]